MFDVEVATARPWHDPEPVKFVNKSALPDGAYLIINAAFCVEAGSVNPELCGVELSAKLFTADVPVFM